MKYSGSQLRGLIIDGAVLLVAAVVVVTTLARNGSEKSIRLSKEDWDALVSGGRVIGSATARATLVEFVDYQCPICARMERVVSQLEESNPGQIRRVIRHYPISAIHDAAEDGAVAVECAADQDRFSEMHAALLSDLSAVGEELWDTLAAKAGVKDMGIYRACLNSAQARQRVQADLLLGDAMGVNGTPTFLLDREWLVNVTPPELRARIQRKLR